MGWRDEQKRTLLHVAASSGQLRTVQFLLREGVNPIAKDEDGNTALHYVIKKLQSGEASAYACFFFNGFPRYRDIFKALVSAGCNPREPVHKLNSELLRNRFTPALVSHT